MTTIAISATATPITTQVVPTPHPSLSTLPRSALPDLSRVRQKPPRVATELEALESIRQCPKFNTCSAPICPLDPNWERRTMNTGQAVCVWFREIAKAGPEAQSVPEELHSRVAGLYPVIVASVGLAPLRASLKRAARSPSTRDSLRMAHVRSLVFKKGQLRGLSH